MPAVNYSGCNVGYRRVEQQTLNWQDVVIVILVLKGWVVYHYTIEDALLLMLRITKTDSIGWVLRTAECAVCRTTLEEI